jgi:hypothetical protein
VGLFRRGGNVRDTDEVTGADGDAAVAAVSDEGAGDAGAAATDAGSAGDATTSAAARPGAGGPWDVSEVDGLGRRLDLGSVWLPGVVGMELRMEVDKSTNQVTGVAVGLAGSALQVQAFAAPRTEGIWDEIRAEIAESVTKQGGAVDEVPGPFGRELLARLPVRTPEGRTGHRPARFIGHDGPRWFVRGVLTGAAAVDPAQAAALEALFADIVVVRGTEARAPRDLLALRLPSQLRPGARPAGTAPGAVTPAAGAAGPGTQPDGGPTPPDGTTPAAPDFDPLTRGPEITEIR